MEDSVPLNPMSTSLDISDALSLNEIFEGSFDSEFFDKVEKRYKEKAEKANVNTDGADTDDQLWNRSIDEIRAERIYEKYSGSGKDPVVAIVKDWMKIFDERAVKDKQLKIFKRDFENTLARLASILINKECETSQCANGKHKCKHGGESPHIFTDPENGTEKTLLHIAAEEGLYILMLELMNRFSKLLYVGTLNGRTHQLPVELALERGHDDVASAIIKTMGSKSVRDLFECDEGKIRCKFRFGDVIKKPNMKKTVVAVLDSLVTPMGADQVNPEDKLRLSGVPDVPTRYHFSYQILDGDNEGRNNYSSSSDPIIDKQERFLYFRDVHNFLDIFGILLILAIVPLRLIKHDSQWNVAAVAYFLNFFRMFKYFPAWKFVGLYSKVLTQMFLYDFSKFALVYLFVMLSFAGSIFLALRATNDNSHIGDIQYAIVVELQGFFNNLSTDSRKDNPVVMILLFINMIMVAVMLVNMLIAQLSYRYEHAQERAELHYDIGKCLMVAKVEQSSFKILKLRVKHYEDGETVLVDPELKKIFDEWKMVKEDLETECPPGMENRA
eukprot:gene20478-22494_t